MPVFNIATVLRFTAWWALAQRALSFPLVPIRQKFYRPTHIVSSSQEELS
jgi:hypothetical protein